MPAEEHPYSDQKDITEEHSFDALAKSLASGTISRSRALRLIGGALFGGVLTAISQRASHAVGECPPPSKTLEGVWGPDRLLVLNPCLTITGTIDVSVLPQYLSGDGDIHNQLTPDPQYRKLLTDQQETYGNFVVELMPRDAGHLPVLPVGPKLTLWGALVYDSGHAWMEIHPVFGYCVEGGSCYTSGPQFGGTPRESTGNAREECFTETGRTCLGYEGQVPTYKEVGAKGEPP
jgi:hypothetical protein